MLQPEQVLPFLSHEDPDVRDLAHANLKHSYARPFPMDEIWRACDRFGLEEHAYWVRSPGAFYFTDEALLRLLDELPGASDRVLSHLSAGLARADFDVLVRHRQAVAEAPRVQEHDRRQIQLRCELSNASPQESWDRLVRLAEVTRGEPEQDIYGSWQTWPLVEALARHPDFVGPRVTPVLRDPQERWNLEYACALLACAVRHEPALDPLIALLDSDGDYVREKTSRGLGRWGSRSPIVVEKVEARWADATWGFRITAGHMLGRCKVPEVEPALLRLVSREQDAEVLGFLGYAMCRIGTTQGLEALRDLVKRDAYDRSITDLRSDLVALARMVGYDYPEAEAWQRHAEKERKRVDAVRRDAEEWFATGEPGFGARSDRRIEKPAAMGLPQQFSAYEPAVRATIRRDEPKVGRNDPCPCGSGKKFKKCCGP